LAAARAEREKVAREVAEQEAKVLAEIEEQEVRKEEERRKAEEAHKEQEWRDAEAVAKKQQEDAVSAQLMEAQRAWEVAARAAEAAKQGTPQPVGISAKPGTKRTSAC
jgi:hypothetical protein